MPFSRRPSNDRRCSPIPCRPKGNLPSDKADGDKTIHIPLKSRNVAGKISFSFNRQMYVNESNLDMSSVYISDYVQTDSLYVPVFKQEKMQNNELNIVLVEAGFDQSNITIPLRYVFDSNYFGYCDESEYCIHGGVRE